MEKMQNNNHTNSRVWIVKQTQLEAGYNERTIGVFTNENAAIQTMSNLNEKYMTEEHYYTTEKMCLFDNIPEHFQYTDGKY
jgi:hypothetical protein